MNAARASLMACVRINIVRSEFEMDRVDFLFFTCCPAPLRSARIRHQWLAMVRAHLRTSHQRSFKNNPAAFPRSG